MTWVAASDKIVDLLLNVDGISGGAGTAIDFNPEIADHPTLVGYMKELSSGKKRLNFWFVERTGLGGARGGRRVGLPLGWGQFSDTFTIKGFYNWTGRTSYVDFNNLTERVISTLLANISLGSPNLDWHTTAPVATMGYANFKEVLCHSVEITLILSRPQSVTFA